MNMEISLLLSHIHGFDNDNGMQICICWISIFLLDFIRIHGFGSAPGLHSCKKCHLVPWLYESLQSSVVGWGGSAIVTRISIMLKHMHYTSF